VILVEIIFAAGEDYSGTNLTLSFPPEVDSLTAMLQIIDDNRLEAVEQFTANLLLGAGQDRVTLGADSATVEITDDDSKLQIWLGKWLGHESLCICFSSCHHRF